VPEQWCHFDADAGLPDAPDDVRQAGDFQAAWLYAFAPGPVDAGDTSKEAGLTDMTPHEDTSRTHSVVQAQPNLEVWPFVAMVQSSHTPTVLTNPHQPDNPIIFANDAFLQLTGYGRDEVLGRNCRFLSGPETSRAVSNEVRHAVETARPVSVKMTLPRQTGPDVKFEHHLEEGHDEEDAEAVHGGVQSGGGCPAGWETLSSVAQALGVAATQVKTWRLEQQAAGSAEAVARRKVEAAELQQLRRDNKRLQEENEILRKASAFFAREKAW
jgi:PAS domain S-box-containing protein